MHCCVLSVQSVLHVRTAFSGRNVSEGHLAASAMISLSHISPGSRILFPHFAILGSEIPDVSSSGKDVGPHESNATVETAMMVFIYGFIVCSFLCFC